MSRSRRPAIPPLEPEQKKDRDDFERLTALLETRVRSVVKRYQTGAYLVGRPGSGKTHTVRRVLDECKADYVYLNGRITAAALFEEFAERSDSIIVIDDVPALFDSPQAMQILMAAVGGKPNESRAVTYVTKAGKRRIEFTGGLVGISNCAFSRHPLASALASRLVTLEHEPSDRMLIAFMAAEARKGSEGLAPVECVEVLDFVVNECRAGSHRIDLRHYYKALQDYMCWKNEVCRIPWKTLVKSAMHSIATQDLPATPSSRAETAEIERAIVQEIHALKLTPAEAEAEWKRRTGKSMAGYYRHRRAMRLK